MLKGAILFPSTVAAQGNSVKIDIKRSKEKLQSQPAYDVSARYWDGREITSEQRSDLESLLSKAGLSVGFKGSRREVEWGKLPEILSMGVQALTGTKFKDAASYYEPVGIWTQELLEELHYVSLLQGVPYTEILPLQRVPEDLLSYARERMEAKGQAPGSLAPTLKKGKPVELEAIYGRVIDAAKAEGVSLPYFETVYRLLGAVQERTLGRSDATQIVEQVSETMSDFLRGHTVSAVRFLKPEDILPPPPALDINKDGGRQAS